MAERRIDPRTGSVEYVDDHGDERARIDGLRPQDLEFLRRKRGSGDVIPFTPIAPADNGGWAPVK